MSTTTATSAALPAVVDLNVSGVLYSAPLTSLQSEPGSLLSKWFDASDGSHRPCKDSQGRFFIDRDGNLFRFILDYLRNGKQLILPENFTERDRLKREADELKLAGLYTALSSAPAGSLRPLSLTTSYPPAPASPAARLRIDNSAVGYITVGYRGSFAFGRDGLADVKFRKLTRILVSGKVNLCREVFGESLNESRDPDHGTTGGITDSRYSSRFFLKHVVLEQAFDNLQEAGFRLVTSCGSGTSSGTATEPLKPGMDSEESKWNHYNEFIFCRP